MARCWTCGAYTGEPVYRCSACRTVKEIRELKEVSSSISAGQSVDLSFLAKIQQRGFEELSDRLSDLVSSVEWGFNELSWQLHQQTDILRSIDHTLRSPSMTQANEWRRMAEELRIRGVLNESEEFYLKALDLNRLDYRIYIGLSETYLQMSKFHEAKTYLERSLPHAPKGEIDYKSYSYRLIGHIYACWEEHHQAAQALQFAVELSPHYVVGHYDYAQYCARIGNNEGCLESLRKAIAEENLYFYLSQKEKNFEPLRSDVNNLLTEISSKALLKAKEAISDAETALKEASNAIERAEVEYRDIGFRALLSRSTYDKAKSELDIARNKINSQDYVAFLDATPIAQNAINIANDVKGKIAEDIKREQDIARRRALVEAGPTRARRKIYNKGIERQWKSEKCDEVWPFVTFLLFMMFAPVVGMGISASINDSFIGGLHGLMVGFILWFIIWRLKRRQQRKKFYAKWGFR